MATTLRVLCTLQNETALPENAATNTWHFRSNGVDPVADAEIAVAELKAFYQEIDQVLSNSLTGFIEFKVYDLVNPEPRVPIVIDDDTVDISSTTGLPNECAVALSYRAAAVSGVNAARRRGRIFIGPLDSDTLENGVGDVRPTAASRALIRNAASDLLNNLLATDVHWAVFSPTTAGAPPWSSGELAASTFDVNNGYIDNAYDTIRSRGALPTDREIFGIVV